MQPSSAPSHLALLRMHLFNAEEAYAAYRTHATIPPLRLRTGVTIHHSAADPIAALFSEIVLDGCYVAPGFYSPAPTDTVVDCGANIGVAALHFWGLAPGMRIFCFEPCAGTARRLQFNVEANGLQDRVAVFPLGLWDHEADLPLWLERKSGDCSLFNRAAGHSAPVESVHCISLGQALDRCEVETVDLLKIDAEGAEIEILRGARAVDWSRIRRLVVEYHDMFRPGCRETVVSLLESHGFQVDIAIHNPKQGIIKAVRQTCS
jgi:FkbM family methyltransferase